VLTSPSKALPKQAQPFQASITLPQKPILPLQSSSFTNQTLCLALSPLYAHSDIGLTPLSNHSDIGQKGTGSHSNIISDIRLIHL
jgi:hypothetical protein